MAKDVFGYHGLLEAVHRLCVGICKEQDERMDEDDIVYTPVPGTSVRFHEMPPPGERLCEHLGGHLFVQPLDVVDSYGGSNWFDGWRGALDEGLFALECVAQRVTVRQRAGVSWRGDPIHQCKVGNTAHYGRRRETTEPGGCGTEGTKDHPSDDVEN